MKTQLFFLCLYSGVFLATFSLQAQPVYDQDLLQQAKQGYVESQTTLAQALLRGHRGFLKDTVLSLYWNKKAARQRSAEAQYNIAGFYLGGWSVDKDVLKGIDWLEKAATQGSDKAAVKLGQMFQRGQYVLMDFEQARRWYQLAAQRGDAQGKWQLAYLYLKGWGGTRDYVTALRWFQESAETGNGKAMYYLGCMYKDGLGVTQSNTQAVAWYEKGSKVLFNHKACYALGYMHYKGLGTEQDYAQAAALFAQSTRLGNRSARFMLGLCYARGQGVPRDPARARKLFEKNLADKSKHYQTERAVRQLQKDGGVGTNSQNSRFAANEKEKQRDALVPDQYRSIAPPHTEVDITGEWEGYLVRYDWSGQELEDAIPVKTEIQRTDNQLLGWLQISDSVTISLKGVIQEGTVAFSEETTFEQRLWYDAKPVRWKLQQGQFENIASGSHLGLIGNLSLYSPQKQEPGNPTTLVLKRAIGSEPWSEQISIFPNPFLRTLNIRFSAVEEGTARVIIYDLQGAEVFATTLPQTAGRQWHTLSPDVQPGVYLIKILSNGKALNEQKIIKY